MGNRGALRQVLDTAATGKGRALTRDDFAELRFTDDVRDGDRRFILDELRVISADIAKAKGAGDNAAARRAAAEAAADYAHYFDDSPVRQDAHLDNAGPREIADAIVGRSPADR